MGLGVTICVVYGYLVPRYMVFVCCGYGMHVKMRIVHWE